MKAVRLHTEYLKNPLGISFQTPQLFWNCQDGQMQTAYQIRCQTLEGTLLWDSGPVESSSMRAVYGGTPLDSRAQVWWQVRLWDQQKETGPWSEWASFEVGLLHREDWKAQWITGNYHPRKKCRYPVDCFRKEVQVGPGLKKARLYITACGLYEARIAGGKVGEFCLAPGITDYRKRVQCQTYDVTTMLIPGKNVLTVQLADGWYRGSVGAWGIRNAYGKETKFLAQLELDYEDGQHQILGTDASWQWSNDGPIRFADNKDGEIVEAFRTPSYRGQAKVTHHPVLPTPSDNVPVTEHERFTPIVTKAPNDRWLLDFGQNLAGYISFHVQANQGDRLFFRFGEKLDQAGNLTLQNIQCRKKQMVSPLQQINYICKEGENRYKTTFAVFGFQYAEVETTLPLTPENVQAVAVYSDMEETGEFECSDPLLNQFVKATRWSAKGNSLDLPTDCPTRERHGWTGDAQIFFDTAAYLFDYAAFSRKFLRDMFDWQKANGCLPQIAPYGGVDFYMAPMNGSAGWSDAGILIPYRLWKRYGDRKILEESYPAMKRYARFLIHRCGRWGGPFAKKVRLPKELRPYLVNAGQSYGEWLEPADVHPMDWKDMAAPHPEVSTAYTAHVLELMGEIAQELGQKEDAQLFGRYSQGCKRAYQAMAQLPEFTLNTDRQARLVRPLAFGLLTEPQTTYAQKRLLTALEHYSWRLGTGFLSTPLILDVLSVYNLKAAYRLLENHQMPGWLYMVQQGATTVWEDWEGNASRNHYSKGAVCQWLFQTMCGIHVTGENRFTIAPQPGGNFSFAYARYQSPYGLVKCSWKRMGDSFHYQVEIPSNCQAELCLPGQSTQNLGPGTYSFPSVPFESGN